MDPQQVQFIVMCGCGRTHYHNLQNDIFDEDGVKDTAHIKTATTLKCMCGQTHTVSIANDGGD